MRNTRDIWRNVTLHYFKGGRLEVFQRKEFCCFEEHLCYWKYFLEVFKIQNMLTFVVLYIFQDDVDRTYYHRYADHGACSVPTVKKQLLRFWKEKNIRNLRKVSISSPALRNLLDLVCHKIIKFQCKCFEQCSSHDNQLSKENNERKTNFPIIVRGRVRYAICESTQYVGHASSGEIQ